MPSTTLKICEWSSQSIKKIKPNKKHTDDQNRAKLHDAIVETFKYSVKPSDLLAYDDSGAWLHEITRQTHKMRFIATGGVLKGILKAEDAISNSEMIHVNGDDSATAADDGTRFGFSYTSEHRRYIYNPKFNEYPKQHWQWLSLCQKAGMSEWVRMSEATDRHETSEWLLWGLSGFP